MDVFLWYSVARRTQQEKRQQQVKAARASPLAFSSIASQPRSFSYTPKMARNAKFAYFVAMVLGRTQQAAGKCQQQVKSARASPLVLIPIANQPHRLPKDGEKCEMRLLRCYGTRPRAAGSRRNTHQ